VAAKRESGRATTTEVERLRTVYRQYMPRVAGRWDARNGGVLAILDELERQVAAVLVDEPLPELRVLDVGCGFGHFLGLLERLGARPEHLHGIDLLAERIGPARSAHPTFDLRVGNAEELPWPDRSFDLVLVFSVFTSILDARMRAAVAGEVTRVLEPRGAILWYDLRFDNPWNPNVSGIGRREVQRLFPRHGGQLRTVTFLPPLARRLGPLMPAIYPVLAAVPPLRSHRLGLLRGA
jgi:ubiquinone/menaquinone biosynthesis C-methylase UbiE